MLILDKLLSEVMAYVYNVSLQHYVIKFVRLATGLWFSPDTPVSSTNKTDCHNINEILLKVALNTIKPTNQPLRHIFKHSASQLANVDFGQITK
jgi:hypothetical protein